MKSHKHHDQQIDIVEVVVVAVAVAVVVDAGCGVVDNVVVGEYWH